MQKKLLIIVAVVNTDRTRGFTPNNSILFLDGSKKPQFQYISGGNAELLNFLEKELLVEIVKKQDKLIQDLSGSFIYCIIIKFIIPPLISANL